MCNSEVTEPTRRKLEQPSAEQAKRSGCLTWGAVLGVLVGIMVGVYALPPILKHYYGEKVVAAGETYEGSFGTRIKVESLGMASDPLGEAAPGMRRFDFFASVALTLSQNRTLTPELFTLEFEELDDWQRAATIDSEPDLYVPEFTETTIGLHFIVELPVAEAEDLTPKALHLSDPRVKFEVAR